MEQIPQPESTPTLEQVREQFEAWRQSREKSARARFAERRPIRCHRQRRDPRTGRNHPPAHLPRAVTSQQTGAILLQPPSSSQTPFRARDSPTPEC